MLLCPLLGCLAAWLAVRLICVRTILFVFLPSPDLLYTDNEPTPGRLSCLYEYTNLPSDCGIYLLAQSLSPPGPSASRRPQTYLGTMITYLKGGARIRFIPPGRELMAHHLIGYPTGQ